MKTGLFYYPFPERNGLKGLQLDVRDRKLPKLLLNIRRGFKSTLSALKPNKGGANSSARLCERSTQLFVAGLQWNVFVSVIVNRWAAGVVCKGRTGWENEGCMSCKHHLVLVDSTNHKCFGCRQVGWVSYSGCLREF